MYQHKDPSENGYVFNVSSTKPLVKTDTCSMSVSNIKSVSSLYEHYKYYTNVKLLYGISYRHAVPKGNLMAWLATKPLFV